MLKKKSSIDKPYYFLKIKIIPKQLNLSNESSAQFYQQLNIESKMHHISILDYIFLTFNGKLPRFLTSQFGAQ